MFIAPSEQKAEPSQKVIEKSLEAADQVWQLKVGTVYTKKQETASENPISRMTQAE